jgi:hypothetical protein
MWQKGPISTPSPICAAGSITLDECTEDLRIGENLLTEIF